MRYPLSIAYGLTSLFLAAAPARAQKATITTIKPPKVGDVTLEIVETVVLHKLKVTAEIKAADDTAAKKATKIAAAINAATAADDELFKDLFTAAADDDVVTVKTADGKAGIQVKILKDGTGEKDKLKIEHPKPEDPDAALEPWAWQWIRIWPVAQDGLVPPAGTSGIVRFDAADGSGWSELELVADGVKTLGALQAELSGMLAAKGFDFTLDFVPDADGDRYELVSQRLPVSLATSETGFFAVEYEVGWSDVFGTMGVSLDDGPARPFGFCDGTGSQAPCGNTGGRFEGCANSTGSGAILLSGGTGSLALDDLTMHAEGLPPGQPALLFAGMSAILGGHGVSFGDGLRCAGGSIVRLGIETPGADGRASYGPGLGALAIGAGAWLPGDERFFQAWYRDPAGPCGQGFNLSAGSRAIFLP